ncbi:unnamed protein product [Blepharisma stoltei]|uniref:C2 domain-containing protein n=1 Tax=Blepharisma stoltei TaxID=1481888 RepID=A0AAU9KGA9_9CILI|nr:unnamed protein product [Blepharisma stoltei]
MANSNRYLAEVQLFISCRKLKDMDTFSKSDPFVEVYEKNSTTNKWKRVDRTEVIWNNLNPDFVKSFKFPFQFEEQKYFQFKVYHAGDDNAKIENDNFIGEAECSLGEIIGSQGQQLIKTLKLPGKHESRGNIILRTEEVSANKDMVCIEMGARGLKDISSLFGTFKPFFCISKAMENGAYQRVYMSEYKKGRNVSWNKIEKSLQDICTGDLDRPLLFEVYDHHKSGNHKKFGAAQVSIKSMTEGSEKSFQLKDSFVDKKSGRCASRRGKKEEKTVGTMVVRSLDIVKVHSFIDYIAGGCQISLIVAIDFTASNMDPRDPQSLHYLNPNNMFNQYQSALFSVGEILLNYDSDKLVPFYGFGAKLNGAINHCFPINFNNSDPNVQGLDGLMHSYSEVLNVIEFSGPTLFAQVIQKAVLEAERAQVHQGNQQYFVLLILTDGEIHDMRATIDWIVRGSASPISIVIVGIGNDSFSNMVVLDADEEPLIDSNGKRMERDIVQFVPFREVGNSPVSLAREVLDEIPREIVNFFNKKGIFPNPPVSAPEFDFSRSYSTERQGIAVEDVTFQVGGNQQSLPQNIYPYNPNTVNFGRAVVGRQLSSHNSRN